MNKLLQELIFDNGLVIKAGSYAVEFNDDDSYKQL